MGVRRYSRNVFIRQRQERFDELQRRVGIDAYQVTIGELREAGIVRFTPVCRDYKCLHQPEDALSFKPYSDRTTTRTLRAKLKCSKCGLRRPRLDLVWEGAE